MSGRFLICFAVTAPFVVLLYLIGEQHGWPEVEALLIHPATAAWVQAIGSVGAIGAAAWVVNRQHTLEQRRAVEATTRAHADVLNGAIMVLMSQYQLLANYKAQHLANCAQGASRAFLLPATHELIVDDLKIDRRALAFLVNSNVQQFLLELLLAHDSFHAAAQAVNFRSRLHGDQFQQKLGESGLDLVAGVTVSEVEFAVGQRISVALQRATIEVDQSVDLALKRLLDVGARAPKALGSLFPGSKIIGFAALLPENAADLSAAETG